MQKEGLVAPVDGYVFPAVSKMVGKNIFVVRKRGLSPLLFHSDNGAAFRRAAFDFQKPICKKQSSDEASDDGIACPEPVPPRSPCGAVRVRTWTAEEDAALSAAMSRDDVRTSSWGHIALSAGLENRSGKQVRERWCDHICPLVCKCDMDEEEMNYVHLYVETLGNCWAKIADKLNAAFPPKCGSSKYRSANHVKNAYWKSIQKLCRDGKQFPVAVRNCRSASRSRPFPSKKRESTKQSVLERSSFTQCAAEVEGEADLAHVAYEFANSIPNGKRGDGEIEEKQQVKHVDLGDFEDIGDVLLRLLPADVFADDDAHPVCAHAAPPFSGMQECVRKQAKQEHNPKQTKHTNRSFPNGKAVFILDFRGPVFSSPRMFEQVNAIVNARPSVEPARPLREASTPRVSFSVAPVGKNVPLLCDEPSLSQSDCESADEAEEAAFLNSNRRMTDYFPLRKKIPKRQLCSLLAGEKVERPVRATILNEAVDFHFPGF